MCINWSIVTRAHVPRQVLSLLSSMGSLVNVVAVTMLVWLIFGIFGVDQFKGQFYRCSDAFVDGRRDCVGSVVDSGAIAQPTVSLPHPHHP